VRVGAGDNETLLNAMASDATKEEHVHFHRKALIDGGKNAMHLRFLAAMCACGDRGISRHQDLVLPYLLSNQSKILLEVTVVHQALKLRDWYYDLSDLPEDAQDLGELCSGSLRQTEKGAKQKRMLDYFVESLLLLATLCKPDSSGRRDFVVQKVRHFLTLSQCKMCLENELLPEHLRRNMCEFVRVVYVQDDSFNKVTRLSGVCIWSDLEAQEKPPAAARGSTRGSSAAASDQKVDGDALSQDAEAGTDMQDLKNIIREYLSQNACQYYPGRTPHSNPLKLSMIRLCRELVLYGHYLESELVGVVKEACIILDFSSMRFIDESKGESLGSMAASKQQDTFQGVLTEQTVSLALQHLRPLCKNIAPIEMARFRSVFKCRVYETGDLMVEAGENAADMFVIQSGAAFMLQTTDGVDSVVDTVGQGEVFGVDTLSRDKKTWPWRVRCSQRVTALHLSAQALYNVSSEMARTGKLSMTDGLEVVLETKREACALINDIYDLRLRVRTMKMLQEYRFDLNISQKVYTRENLTGTGDDLEAGDILALLPQKLASHQLVIPQDFYIDDTPVLGSFLSQRLKPMESFVLGWPRIDRAVLVVAILQYLLAAVLMLLMALRIKSLLEEQSPDAALADDAVRPASASLGVHPGLSRPVAPLVVNLVLTLLWSVTQLGVAWSALSHARTGKEVTVANSEGDKFVQYMTNPLGAQIGFVAQFAYLLFWVANTATGLVAGLMALGNGAAGASSAVLTQALWLVLGTGLGLYNGLAFASLYVHLQRPALFLQDTSQEEEQGEQVEADLPRREFLKILEYLDLDDNGALSQTLADLIISPYKPLVVDAFNLLVRTHDSNRQLHAQLVNMLILDSSAEIADPKRLMYISDELTKALLGVTNAMQAYVVERSNEQMRLKEKKEHAKQQAARQARARSTQLTAKQRELEVQRNDEMARLRKEREQQEQSDSKTQASHIKEVEPLLNQLLTMMDDKVRAREKVQRRLLQRKGMHWIVLRLLACLPADFTETTGPLCYRALARLCDGAPNIQAELAQHVHVFYAHFDSIPHEVAFVLSAIYKDNVNLCYTVEEYMMKKIAALIKDDLAAPYLMLAKIIITPKDQIVRRNQNLIIKHLDSLDVQLLLFQGGAKALRKTLLSDSSAETPASSLAPVSRGKSAKATKMLQVHIGSIELLTACMAEYNHDNKKRCRGGNPNLTLTLADVEADLYDRELPVSVKRALLDFLVQAYILVDMSNINLLMQPEITNVFDQLARWIELLPVDTRGSKVTRLTKSERSLLTDTYMAAAKAFFSTLPESGRVRVGGRLLEALVELLLSCRPGGTSQSDLQGEEELRILEVVMLLARSIKDSFERYPLLVGQKEGSRLRKVLGASELTLNEDDDEENAPPEGKCERQIQLKDEMTLEHERSKHLPLSVSEGMVVFGNDFLSVMSGPGSPSNEFDTLCAAFLQAKPLVQMGPVATRGADAAKGDTGGGPAGAAGGGDDEMPVSNQHLESLVDLMTTCESLTAEMQQTGLLIIGKVVKSVKFLDDGVEDRKEQRDWLHTGVPKMLVRLITAASSNDSIVRECLKIAIEFLESGKRPAQDAFYTLLTSTTSEVSLFQKLRDRLVRGERGLGIYQATFLRLSQELHSQCSTLGKVLTIEGVRRLTQADRLVQSFLGSYPEEVLRFLQLLCEGHNKDMQEYMQYQGKTSVDMVSCAADFVAACSRHMHPASISFANQCVQTLIEFVQNPCYRNQRALVDTQLPHVLNQFLQLSPDLPVEFFDVDTYLTDISTLKRNSVTLLLSLLERVDDRFIPSRILKALEMEKILASINALRAGYLGLEPGEEPPEDDEEASAGVAHESIAEHEDFQVACALFMLVRMLQYFDEDKLSGLSSKCNKNYIYDMERLQANCGFIEISRDNRLERIFFQIPPVCRYLSPASKNAILRDVNRENHQDQLLDFVERAHVRYDEMVHLQDLHRSSLYQCFLMVSGHLDVTFFLNAVLINLLALFSYRYRDAQVPGRPCPRARVRALLSCAYAGLLVWM
jgi:CRP-like cAMP-binding protein